MISKWLVPLRFDTASVDTPTKKNFLKKSTFAHCKASHKFDLNNLDREKSETCIPIFFLAHFICISASHY